jgi:WD40 repeat protein
LRISARRRRVNRKSGKASLNGFFLDKFTALTCKSWIINGVALLPDDKTLVDGCKDGAVCLWDTSVPHPHQPRITVPAKVGNWRFSPRQPFYRDFG